MTAIDEFAEVEKQNEHPVKAKITELYHWTKSSPLTVGNTGYFVKILQGCLISLCYGDPFGDEMTGTFDEPTQQAVKQFQGDNSLIPTGVVGPPMVRILYQKIEGILERETEEGEIAAESAQKTLTPWILRVVVVLGLIYLYSQQQGGS